MEEIWKDIEGYEGYYQISTLGRIKSVARIVSFEKYQYKLKKMVQATQKVPEKIRTGYSDDHGYYRVELNKDGKSTSFLVHRLVASTFIPNPENKREVNHIDGNPSNNHLDNLEWVTSSENKFHAYRIGLHVVSEETRKKLSDSLSNRGYTPRPTLRKSVMCVETQEKYESMEDAKLRSGATADHILASIRDGQPHYSRKLNKWLTFVRT